MSDGDGVEDLPPDLIVEALSTYARDLISLLSLAAVAGIISRNNSAIITQEIDSLLALFRESMSSSTLRPGYVLSNDFFAADPELQDHLNRGLFKGHPNFISDKIANQFNEKIPFPQIAKKQKGQINQSIKVNPNLDGDSIKDKKDFRQMKIVTLLRSRSNLSIKDFASVIPDCSEKTIQRELLELVEKGVIKKEGERRWSTYSIK